MRTHGWAYFSFSTSLVTSSMMSRAESTSYRAMMIGGATLIVEAPQLITLIPRFHDRVIISVTF